MKKFFLAPQFVFLCLAALSIFPHSKAADVQVRGAVVTSATTVTVNTPITFTISITNVSTLPAARFQVVSRFPTTAALISASSSLFSTNLPGTNPITTNSGEVIFAVDSFSPNQTAQMTVVLRPTQVMTLTNVVTFEGSGISAVTPAPVAVTVTRAEADLALGVERLPPNLVVNDRFTYTLTVTNFGPAVASSVDVQTLLPAGTRFISAVPSSAATVATNTLHLKLNTLSNNVANDFVVTLQVTNSGRVQLVHSVTTADTADKTPANNAITNSISVVGAVTNSIAIVSVSQQVFNRQTGLMDQVIVISNKTAAAIPSVRLLATNLPTSVLLYYGSGTNGNSPFLVLPVPLAATNTATIAVQLFVPSRTPIDVGYLAMEGPDINPLPVPIGTDVPVTRVVHLRNALRYSSVYLDFATVIGRTYSVVYTTTVDGTNRVAALPPFVANSTHGQFIDSGAAVTGEGDRFYTVVEQQ